MKIVLDPGHSGDAEPGACAAGLHEADLVLSITRRLRRRLLAAGHEVRLTRDRAIDDAELSWRAELANAWGAEVFISLHVNAALSPDAEGTEVYHFPGSVAGEALASAIQASLVAQLHTDDRGVKAANFAVLRETVCPAALIETAFVSNAADRALLSGAASQEAFTVAIAAGVAQYCSAGAARATCAEWALF